MVDERRRNLKVMLSEAKDTSELMVDLGYASLYLGDSEMAAEVGELAEDLHDLIHEIRSVCVLAARSPRDADAMASVLQVTDAMAAMGEAASDIARIVSRSLGIPAALVADLSAAEEVTHRFHVHENSALSHRSLAELELPTEVGMRVVAIRRGRSWVTEVEGDEVLRPDDVVIVQGAPAGVPELRELAGEPTAEPPRALDEWVITDLDRAVDVLVDMKNVSEVAVGLAYSALVLRDIGLAAEVSHLEQRLDEMKERLELWVLRAAHEEIDPSGLRGLLHLAGAAETIGDAAKQMVWMIEEGEELHPVLALGLGDAEEISVRVPVADGCRAEGKSLRELQLETETGFYLLAVRRGGRYLYRPRPGVVLLAGDELIATGPYEGHDLLAGLCGYEVVEDPATGVDELRRLASARG